MRVTAIFAAVAAALYLVLLAAGFLAQRGLLYHPGPSHVSFSGARVDPHFQEFAVRTGDGLDLKGWYAPATTRPFTIVFFHGNADGLSTALPIAAPYIAAGYGFLVATYRGYSGLAGRPTETGLYNDGRAYLEGLAGRGVAGRSTILFGHSLGAGVAVQMAVEREVGGVMLLAPFLSVPRLARSHVPLLPSFLILDRFDNEGKIGRIQAPLLIANGDRDQVVPPWQGARLYALAGRPKEYHSLPGRGHNDAFDPFAPLSIGWIARACSPGARDGGQEQVSADRRAGQDGQDRQTARPRRDLTNLRPSPSASGRSRAAIAHPLPVFPEPSRLTPLTRLIH